MPAMSSGNTTLPSIASEARLKACMEECFRVLRPGGFLWGLEAFFRTHRVASLAEQVGFEQAHVVNSGCYYVAAIPQKAFVGAWWPPLRRGMPVCAVPHRTNAVPYPVLPCTARKSVLAGLVPGEDEEADAAATVASLSVSGFPSTRKMGLREMLQPVRSYQDDGAGGLVTVERGSNGAAGRGGAPAAGGRNSKRRSAPRRSMTASPNRSSTVLLAAKLRTSPTCACVSRDGALQAFGQLLMLGVWAAYLYIIVRYWDDLAVPVREHVCWVRSLPHADMTHATSSPVFEQKVVPWTTQIRTQLMQNVRVYPVSLYFCYLELHSFIIARQVRAEAAVAMAPHAAPRG